MRYQTIPLPDGTIRKGLFDTIGWFNKIAKHVSFEKKTLADIGCCQFSYGIQAINNGAKFVYGIDSDIERVQESLEIINKYNYGNMASVWQEAAEKCQPPMSNIILFSMVIHWLANPEIHIQKLIRGCDTAIFIYRVMGFDNDTGYLPTINELDSLIGKRHLHYEVISETKEQNIRLAIYDLRESNDLFLG